MRTFVVAVLLALPAFALPSASAAGPLLADAAGDVQYGIDVAGTALPGVPAAAGDMSKAADLVGLDIVEAEETLVFSLTVVSLKGEPSGIISSTVVGWGREEYGVQVGYFNGGAVFGGQGMFAALLRRQGTDWEFVARLDDPALDMESARIVTTVPKVYFLDEQGRIPGRGDTLRIERVLSDTNFAGFEVFNARMADAMPDDEGEGASFTLAMGDHTQGNIVLTTPDRVRVSNGGATTFVFTLTVRNPGEAEEEYALATEDVPAGWNATLRTPVRVPAQSERTVSLLVSVPFAHEHGGYSSFNVTAASTRDAATNARMRLGVLHTPIPQPAGHHSELFLHARDPRDDDALGPAVSTLFPYAYGWMNTQADHADDAEFMTPFSEGDDEVAWSISLNPGLRMGLDFDIDGLGKLEGSLLASRDAAVEVAAELYYTRGDRNDGETILLAEGEPVAVTLSAQSAAPFELVMVPTREADHIPYAADAGMYLVITMAGADPRDAWFNNPLRVRLDTASFKLALPLNEYHDRLSGEAEAAQAITILAKGLVEKAGRPGSVLTYPFAVRNDGAPDTFVLDLAGNDISRARLVPKGEIVLATGESREVTLAVELPIDANPGQEFEALLFVHARDDPSKMAIARTKTRATDDAAVAMPDESADLLAAQARENQTPAPSILLALVVAALLATRRMR